jgi:hypothetical protein
LVFQLGLRIIFSWTRFKFCCQNDTILSTSGLVRDAGTRGLFVSSRNSSKQLLVVWAIAAAGLFGVFGNPLPANASAGINSTINFQGRLLSNSGAVVADGDYNMEFTIVQDGTGCVSSGSYPCSGTTTWTEDWLNDYSGGVVVKNGYFSVNLGTWCSFSGSACTGGQTQSNSGVNWNDNTLWLSMNVGNPGSATSATCTDAGGASPCTFDGPLLPLREMSSTVYAQSANGLTSANGLLTSSQFVQLAQGVQNNVSVSTNPAIGLNITSGSNDIVELQSSGSDVFDITSAGNALFGSGAAHTISVAQPASGGGAALTISAAQGASGTGAAGGLLTLQGGAGGGTNGNGGGVTIDAGAVTGSGTAGAISIGTANAGSITIGGTAAGSTAVKSGTGGLTVATNATATGSTNSGAISVTTGNASGTTSNSGSITLNVGTATGTPGGINIGTANIGNTVQIGSTSLSSGTQVIDIGNNNTSGGTTNVTIGTGTSAAGGSTTVQAKGALSLQGGAASTINTTAASLTISTTTSGNLDLNSAQALNFTGAGASTWDIGNNTLSLQTTNNGAITTGTGNITLGGNTTVSSNKSFTADGSATFSDATSSASAFVVQSGSSSVLGVDTSANQVLLGQSGFGGKLVVYGSTSGDFTLEAAATISTPYSLTLPNAGDGTSGDCLKTDTGTSSTATTLTWGACGGGSGGTQTVTLVPEFAGATYYASGSNNTGYMQSDYDSTNYHNYYEWSTDQSTAQTYDLVVQYQIPTGYSSSGTWSALTEVDSTTGTSIQVDMKDTHSGTTTDCSGGSFATLSTTTSWQSDTISDSCTLAANDIVTLDFRLQSTGTSTVWTKLGALTFTYQ